MEEIAALLLLCVSAVAMATPTVGAYRLVQTIPILATMDGIIPPWMVTRDDYM